MFKQTNSTCHFEERIYSRRSNLKNLLFKLFHYKVPCNYTRKKAFTLAEVLITLGIIGVVAAITIPSLISKYEKKQFITSLQKEFTVFNQALLEYSTDKGCNNNMACTGAYNTSDKNTTMNEIIPYLNINKACGTSNGCFYNGILKNLDNSPDANYYGDTNYAKFSLIDGAQVLLGVYSANCTTGNGRHINLSLDNGNICGDLWIDINGDKSPNTYGRDIFGFWILNNSTLYPCGGRLASNSTLIWNDSTTGVWSCYTTGKGYGCSGRIMEEGWQMNY